MAPAAVELQQQGIQASRPRVARLMRKNAIRSIIRRKYRVQTTDSNHGYAIAENYCSCLTLIEACSMLARNSKSNLQVYQCYRVGAEKATAIDNAVAESFFKTMKTELIYPRKFAIRKEARLAVFEYSEGWYNRRRRHAALSYRTPCQFKNLILQKTVAADKSLQ